MTPRTPRGLLWLSVLCGAALCAAVLLYAVRRDRSAPRALATDLPVYWSLPDFQLEDQGGKQVSRASLRGRVWIADFIFTHCANTCPVMTSQMKRVDDELAKALPAAPRRPMLISFSVDPDRDTPGVLAAYARQIGASESWRFLTGPRAAVTELAVHGFRLAAIDQPEDFTHSSKLVLIDREGRVRGLYDGMSDESVDQLIADALRLFKEDA